METREPPVVEFRSVSKLYSGKTRAVDGFSLTVFRGEIVALLGTSGSGSGKTTALKLINKMEELSEGDVLINGKSIASHDKIELRRSIGYVIQEGGLFPHWTVLENVGLVPRLLHWKREVIQTRSEKVMAAARIPAADFGERYPGTLSGGQRQRVAIARALASDPELLLLDEPFGALDPITRSALHEEVHSIVRNLNKTAILVTHDVTEAFRLADRIALMDKGRLVQFGAPEEIVLSPANDFVRGFFQQHGFDLRLRYLQLERVVRFIESSPCDSTPAIELVGAQTLADALDQIAANGSETFVVRCGDGSKGGPFHRCDVWALLRRGNE